MFAITRGFAYGRGMNDPVALLRERVAKAEAKLIRAEKSVESARTELTEFQTALRVMEGLIGESASVSAPSTSTAPRQSHILSLLSDQPSRAKPPADLFESYAFLGAEEITLDTFRTTIWRMKNKTFDTPNGTVTVRGSDDGYWKERSRAAEDQPAQVPPPAPPSTSSSWGDPDERATDDDDFSDWGSAPSSNPPGGFADDLDDDIEF